MYYVCAKVGLSGKITGHRAWYSHKMPTFDLDEIMETGKGNSK
jgi:hypothetical protein